MTRGQETLTIDIAAPARSVRWRRAAPVARLVPGTGAARDRAVADELAAHRAYLDALERDSKGAASGLGSNGRRPSQVTTPSLSRWRHLAVGDE